MDALDRFSRQQASAGRLKLVVMSKFGRFAAALVVGVPVLFLAALYLLVKPDNLRPVVEQQLSAALQRPTSVASMTFHLFPPNFSAAGLVIGDDPAFSKAPFVEAKSVELIPQLLPLFTGRLEIESIRLVEPQVEFIQNEAGKWNYESIGGNQKSTGSEEFRLGKLLVDLARVGVRQPLKVRQEYSRLSAELRNFAKGTPFQLKLSAKMPEGEAISFAGTLTRSGTSTAFSQTTFALSSLRGTLDGSVSGGALNLQIEIPKSPIADLAPLFLPKTMSVKGDLIAKLKVTGTTENPALNGRIDVTGFEVSGAELKQPVKTAKLALTLAPERITLEPANITSGSTQVQAFGVVSHYAASPVLDATLLAPNSQLPELLSIAKAYGISSLAGISASGRTDLQIRVHGPLKGTDPFEVSGSGSLSDANIQFPSLTKPLIVKSTGFRFESNSASLSNIDAQVAATNLKGNIKLSNFSRPAIAFALVADKASLEELRSLVKQTEDKKNAAPVKITAEGTLEVGALKLADLTLSQVSSQANYRDGHLVLNPFNALMYGGRHSGSIDIDLGSALPVYSINSKLEKVESSQFLAATTSLKGIVSGPFSATLNLKFSPADPMQLARSLNGTIGLKFDQGKIASFNLTNELANIAEFLGFKAGGEQFTQFLGITGDLSIVNGAASTQNLKLDLANLTAGLTGSMNLADQTLDLKLLSILDRKFSEQVGSNRIGGFMTMALANPTGNLMIPARIRGTFSKPIMAPDPEAIAKMKLQSFSPKDPKQLMDSVNSVLDLFKKKQP